MILINRTSSPGYSKLAHRDIAPSGTSANINAAGLVTVLTEILKDCGKRFLIRLDDKEKELLKNLQTLNTEGEKYEIKKVVQEHPLAAMLRKEEEEKKQKIASIIAAQKKEAEIKNEATYTTKEDIRAAKEKSDNLKGKIEAKKLDTSSTTISLKDLMGDNKFIEESMKHSGVATVVASDEGWDMAKINAPKVKDVPADAAPQEAPAQPSEETPKKSSRRRKGNK